ncbi:HAD family phosphatase [Candidatus Saccharibacteria bacterium]|nr:MAG: HAD family phosphatase [Candidatus Saccharibacteria bacterium]
MIRAVIFDCFGVLITDALQAICSELRQRDVAAADEVRNTVSLSNRGITDPEASSRKVASILGISYEEYRERIANGEVKNTELLHYIHELRASYKTALLSNIGKGSLLRRFTEDEFARYFDAVIASGDVGFAKPEPQIYEITADQLGVRFDECVFTDDREEFCEAARAVGMQAILYEDFLQFRTNLETLLSK